MGIVGYNCFTPDYSELQKILVNDDGEVVNDMHFFQAVQGTAEESLAMGLARPQSAVPDFFAEGADDETLFDSVVPKSIQTTNELSSYGSIFLDDLNKTKK